MTDYALVLVREYPDRLWTLHGDDYAGLNMTDDGPKPTKAKLDGLWPKVQYDVQLEQIKAERNARYQAETDPLFFKAQRGEDGITMADWQTAVDAIRADLPYPEMPA